MDTGKVEYAPDYKSGGFRDFLNEQMKDPEFAAAYKQISAEEDQRHAQLRQLEREVIEAAKVWHNEPLGDEKIALHGAVEKLVKFEENQKGDC